MVDEKESKVSFVNSKIRDDCFSLPKSTKILDNMDEDNVYMTSIHDRYAAHPNK